jgi:glucosamine--fructose-6-phosphate aminotransferase (isomerizing)
MDLSVHTSHTRGAIERDIRSTPDAILATLAEARLAAAHAGALIRARGARRLFIIGNGTSYFAALAASYVARNLAGPSSPQVIAMSAGDFRTYRPQLDKFDVIVGLSSSGEFRDVVGVFTDLREQALLIGVTQDRATTVGRLAHHTVVAASGPNVVPVMTRTYATTLAATALILLAVYEAGPSWYEGIRAAADSARIAIADALAVAPSVIERLGSVQHGFAFGTGSGWPAAMESALKFKEMALLHVEAAETAEMASGPSTMIDGRHLAIAFLTGGMGDDLTSLVAGRYHEWGIPVLSIGPTATPGAFHVRVPAVPEPALAALALVPPSALIAYRLGVARGLDPNDPTWQSRYHELGLRHITAAQA